MTAAPDIQRTRDSLVVDLGADPLRAGCAVQLAGLAIAVLFLFCMALLLEVPPLISVAGLLPCLGLLAHLARWSQRPVILRAGPGSIELDGNELRPSALVLQGQPGRAMVLRSATDTLFTVGPGNPSWDFLSLGQLARQLAEVTEQPLTDERDAAAWERWSTEPAFRALCEFEAEQEANEFRFPRHFAVEPSTLRSRHDHHSVTYGVLPAGYLSREITLVFDQTQLLCGQVEVPLDQIERAFVRFTKIKNTRSGSACVRLRDGSIVTLCSTDVEGSPGASTAALHAVAERVRHHLPHARSISRGTAQDVPNELRHLGTEDR